MYWIEFMLDWQPRPTCPERRMRDTNCAFPTDENVSSSAKGAFFRVYHFGTVRRNCRLTCRRLSKGRMT